MACRKFFISGNVQGVFFRDSTREKAQALGLTGHAINLDDGRVEVLACGSQAAVDQLSDWLNEGPSRADVDDIETESAEGPPPAEFTTG